MFSCRGLPILSSCLNSAANPHDIRRGADTHDALQTGRTGEKTQDPPGKGYEAGWLKTYLQTDVTSHISGPVKKARLPFKARRRVVRRTHSWMNRFRRVLTRWEKKTANDGAMVHFACGFIVRNKDLLRLALR